MHTNSALATISRLFDLGLKPFVVATAIEAIIAQRLVRKICEHCRTDEVPDAGLLMRLGGRFAGAKISASKGAGCQACYGTGYKGRVGLYEILALDDQLRHMIACGKAITEIAQYAREKGFVTLRDDAYDKVSDGLTSLDEILRVLGPE